MDAGCEHEGQTPCLADMDLSAVRPLPAPRSHGGSARVGLLAAATATYAAAVALALAVLHLLGDRWPPAAMLLFGPRWCFAVPLAILVPAAILARRPGLLVGNGLAALACVGPLMGFTVTSAGLVGPPNDRDLRVMTHNLGRVSPESQRFLAVLDQVRPDVVVLQECSLRGAATLELPGWHVHMEDGLCLFSRFPIRTVDARDRRDIWERGGSGAIIRYEIDAPGAAFDVVNVHLETPRDGLEGLMHGDLRAGAENLEERRFESEIARAWVDRAKGPVLVAGDFNMPVESALYQRYWSGFANAFSEAGWGFGFTKRTRLIGARIDHVLVSREWECVGATIGPETGSDHRPVVVDLRRSR